ncbi:MAG: ABC transporter permease subunit, partial [Sphingomonadaceae bacterium]|nr:ABC transporter permease subunit [Sphingomonadaceae bacterium]
LALLSVRRPALRRVLLTVASVVQTIPGLALLALFYPLLLALDRLLGDAGIPALGFLPALLALALYAVLPILRNAIAGLTGIDPAIAEAADGVGMTPRQKLRLVEAPLAAPVIMAGVRTAAVWTIGAATLSTTVGQPSLGDLIFAGLQTQNWALVLTGCIAAAGLALAADALLGLIERGIARRSRKRIFAGLIALALGVALAFAPALFARETTVVVGAKNFSEQYILARLIGERLERAGYAVSYREGLGSTVAFEALTQGDIDVYVDYSGTLWTGAMARSDDPPREAMLAELGRWVERSSGAHMLGSLGFENAYAFAVRDDEARRLGLATLDDLAARAPTLSLGTDIEFLNRPEWPRVRDAYGLAFADTASYQPTFMYRALASDRADVITAFSSDGRIAADRLVILGDPRGAIHNYDAVLLIAPARARDEGFTAALRPLIGAIPVEAMREANHMVDRDADKRSPAEAARWLTERIGR